MEDVVAGGFVPSLRGRASGLAYSLPTHSSRASTAESG